MAVWRLQTNTAAGKIANYCINNNVAALGWSLISVPKAERESVITFEEYCDYADKLYSSYDSIKRLAEQVNTDDLVWMRNIDGKYYIARVTEKSKWIFNTSDDATCHDACNQLTEIYWKEVNSQSDESCVPGAVSTAFIMGSSFQRINKSGVEDYSKLLYNNITGTNHYNIKLDLTEKNFYSLLSPDDCEDLLYFWLYKEYGYICVPSSNKNSTPNYECVLINPKNGQHIYIQVKKGCINIDAENYKDLDGDVWLLTTEGKVLNYERHKKERKIHIANPTVLYEFARSEDSGSMISKSIKMWVEFLCQESNKEISGAYKGIIFDTNKSYKLDAEKEMFGKKQIIAWGNASKYINAFNINDYVLYYSKGKGVIAIGKIKSEPKEIENGRYCDVEPVVFPRNINETEQAYITPQELQKELNKHFYFASTRKVPFISEGETTLLAELLRKKQNLV